VTRHSILSITAAGRAACPRIPRRCTSLGRRVILACSPRSIRLAHNLLVFGFTGLISEAAQYMGSLRKGLLTPSVLHRVLGASVPIHRPHDVKLRALPPPPCSGPCGGAWKAALHRISAMQRGSRTDDKNFNARTSSDHEAPAAIIGALRYKVWSARRLLEFDGGWRLARDYNLDQLVPNMRDWRRPTLV
jgi:hypothetical protein